MSANVETMFYVREKPWHGLGTLVAEAPSSAEALIYAGLDWRVEQKDVYTEDGNLISGYKVNTRSTDNATLGIVSDRYKVVQNEDAFQFTDDLLGAGVTYETAGSLQGGRKVWMLARMPHRYIIAGDEIAPYLVVMNSHDGSSGIKVAMTPIRVVCQNTLNLALNTAKRIWTTKHTENVMSRVYEARETLELAETYMGELGRGIDALSKIKLTDKKVMEFMEEFFPVDLDMPEAQRKNNLRLLSDMKRRYWDAPDLAYVGKNGYRFVNAISDFATHADPIRKTKNYNENLFLRTVEGNPMIDKAYKMVLAAA
jgi:phage/plasmid-like protein (TIGR03299 family)